MKKIKLFFGIIILIASIYFIYNQYNKLSILNSGTEIVINKEDFSVPLNCEYLHKNSPIFLKFIYDGKEHSIRIKTDKCFEIQKLNELKLLINKKGNIYILKDSKVIIEFYSSIVLFIIFILIFYRLILKPSKK
ncbi:MAG: hypothetical protein AB8B78_14980 [Polaribacter sp.]